MWNENLIERKWEKEEGSEGEQMKMKKKKGLKRESEGKEDKQGRLQLVNGFPKLNRKDASEPDFKFPKLIPNLLSFFFFFFIKNLVLRFSFLSKI